MKRAFVCITIVIALVLCGCAQAQDGTQNGLSGTGTDAASATAAQHEIAHRFASASEGRDLLLSNDEYYAGFSQNDLDFRMQKTGATMEEYKSFSSEQTRDFTDAEKKMMDEYLAKMASSLAKHDYTLPPIDEVTFVKTTMAEQCGAGGYTHGTTIFLSAELLESFASKGEYYGDQEILELIIWHELFHCLTGCNPDFRASMYELIHFSVHDTDYALPPSAMDYHISNPDVKHHDSSATFKIDGKDVECFTDMATTRHFEKDGDNFFECVTTALVPVDGTDTFYTPEQATNFDEVFGRNTEYVVDPEECMADNFSMAMQYGTAGPEGNGYESPEIIEGIISILSGEARGA